MRFKLTDCGFAGHLQLIGLSFFLEPQISQLSADFCLGKMAEND